MSSTIRTLHLLTPNYRHWSCLLCIALISIGNCNPEWWSWGETTNIFLAQSLPSPQKEDGFREQGVGSHPPFCYKDGGRFISSRILLQEGCGGGRANYASNFIRENLRSLPRSRENTFANLRSAFVPPLPAGNSAEREKEERLLPLFLQLVPGDRPKDVRAASESASLSIGKELFANL